MAPDSYWYLATPYTHYELGHEAAFRMASEQAALLMRAGVPVFCPIAHSHPIADFGKLDKVDPEFWRRMDKPMLAQAHGLIYVLAPGYLQSSGMHNEIVETLKAKKPVVMMLIGEVPEVLLNSHPKLPKPLIPPSPLQLLHAERTANHLAAIEAWNTPQAEPLPDHIKARSLPRAATPAELQYQAERIAALSVAARPQQESVR